MNNLLRTDKVGFQNLLSNELANTY